VFAPVRSIRGCFAEDFSRILAWLLLFAAAAVACDVAMGIAGTVLVVVGGIKLHRRLPDLHRSSRSAHAVTRQRPHRRPG
jgi:hypothetical protein